MNKKITSFSVGGLLFNETIAVIDYLIAGKIKELDKVIKTTDVLKTNSEASRLRFLSEIRRRDKAVNTEVWHFIGKSVKSEQQLILFYVCLKASKLLFDFQVEVVLEKWRTLDHIVIKNDALYFIDKKSMDYPEMENWSDNTKEKSATVLIRILNEAGILKENRLIQPDVSDRFWVFFIKQGDPWFLELCLMPKNQRDKIMEIAK